MLKTKGDLQLLAKKTMVYDKVICFDGLICPQFIISE